MINHPSTIRHGVRILAAGILFASLLLSTEACRGKHNRTTVVNEEQDAAPRLASVLKVSDPGAVQQLTRGFYGLEGGAWRWTARRFTVVLKPPVASPQLGAHLSLALSIPDVVTEKLGILTLSASIDGTKLASTTYSKPGGYTFSADVAPELLKKETAVVEFELDKSLPPGPSDQRELGIIATSVGLVTR
jgi:hypothetical protein